MGDAHNAPLRCARAHPRWTSASSAASGPSGPSYPIHGDRRPVHPSAGGAARGAGKKHEEICREAGARIAVVVSTVELLACCARLHLHVFRIRRRRWINPSPGCRCSSASSKTQICPGLPIAVLNRKNERLSKNILHSKLILQIPNCQNLCNRVRFFLSFFLGKTFISFRQVRKLDWLVFSLCNTGIKLEHIQNIFSRCHSGPSQHQAITVQNLFLNFFFLSQFAIIQGTEGSELCAGTSAMNDWHVAWLRLL